jgi:NAD(P)-dependent dehydrogenase (short-subunit alcohol dehydrogenase family)
MIHCGMTKTAQLAISRGLGETTAGTAVTVNAVLPGPTESEGVVGFVDSLAAEKGVTRQEFEKEFFEKTRPSSILQRFTTPEESRPLLCSFPVHWHRRSTERQFGPMAAWFGPLPQ